MASSRTRTILQLSLPIMGGMVSQNLMNLIDTWMVGSLGETALAAVGMGSVATFMAQAFMMGLATGVQAMAARRHGEGRHGEMAVPLNGGLLLAFAIGVPLSVVLYLLAPLLYPYLNSDPEVIAVGVPYVRVRLIGVTAVGINFAFRGYFNGVNQSRLYMFSLVAMHIIDASLTYCFIFGKLGLPPLGAVGSGVGTTVATWIGVGIYLVMGLSHARVAGFLRGLPDRKTLRIMLAESLPSGVRQLFFAAGMTALFAIVGRVGTAAAAAATIMINLMLVAILPGMGMGLAATSLVGQALGRADAVDARRWGWDVTRIAIVVLALIGLPMLVFPAQVLGLFTTVPAVIQEGVWPLRITGATIFLDGIGLVLQNAMLGAGDSRRVMVVAISLQWALFLPAAYLVGPVLGFGIIGVWIAMSAHRALQAGTFAWLWRNGKWATAAAIT